MLGAELSLGWLRFKADRWRAAADPEAVAGYVPMYAQRGLPDLRTRIGAPVLAVTGERDAPPMRKDAVTTALATLCDDVTVVPLLECGHYPRQEMPPRLVAIVEAFLSAPVDSPPGGRLGEKATVQST